MPQATKVSTRFFLTTALALSTFSLAACDEDDALDEEARAADELESPDRQRHHGDKAAHLLGELDADQSGAISTAEAKDHWLSHKFDKLDENEDGSLDATELAALKKHGKHRKRDFMKKLDVDQDGMISAEEAKGPMAEHFAEIDADADGQLSKEELKAHHHERRAQHHERMFAEIDTDQSGTISAEEAKGPMSEHFAEIDADGDGQLSKDELKAAHERMRGKHGKHHRGRHGHEKHGDRELQSPEAAG